MMPPGQPNCRQYVAIVRKLGPLAHLDPSAAAYFTGLADLTVVSEENPDRLDIDPLGIDRQGFHHGG